MTGKEILKILHHHVNHSEKSRHTSAEIASCLEKTRGEINIRCDQNQSVKSKKNYLCILYDDMCGAPF